MTHVPSTHRPATAPVASLAALTLLALLGACGGGGSTGSTGSGGTTPPVTPTALSCDTTLFAAGSGVRVPTSTELATFAATYSGQEGDFNLSGTFVPSGAAVLVVAADGTVTYNGAAQTVSSACVEALPGGGQQLVLHFPKLAGNPIDPHVDLAPGAGGTMTGASPVNLKTIQGARP